MKAKKTQCLLILPFFVLTALCAALASIVSSVYAASEEANIIAPPSVIEDVLNEKNYNGLGTGAEDGALLYLSEDGNIADASGGEIASLQSAWAALKGKTVVSLSVETEGALQALLDYTLKDASFTDATIVSSSAEILKKLKASGGAPWFRRALDLTGGDIDVYSSILAANEAGANIVILPQESASAETVERFQTMAKTVWVKTGGDEEFDALQALSSGAFGLIGDAESIRGAFRLLDGLDGEVLVRRPLNIAHRGEPYLYNENSLEGCRYACENGARALELDFRLTQDGEIVVMHDATIDRTTNGRGSVSAMTLAQIKNCSIVKNIAGIETGTESEIPSVDDVFSFMRQNDAVLYFEIKSEEEALVAKLKTKLEEYGMQDRVVVISFSKQQIQRVRTEIPYVWALDLNYSSLTSFEEYVMNLCYAETGYDIPLAVAADKDFVADMIDRGFMPCFWTYNDQSAVYGAVWDGVFGITNNCAGETGAIACGISAEDCRAEQAAVLAKTAVVPGKTVAGVEEDIECGIVAVKDCETYALAVVVGRAETVYALDSVKIDYGSESAGCSGTLSQGAYPVLAAVVMIVAAAMLKSKGKRQTREEEQGEAK